MFIKSLYLSNFRNYQSEKIDFSPGINAFYGENAQGKTNLLEALSLISLGRSFRTKKLGELIYENESFFYVDARVENQGISHNIKLSFDRINKKLQIDSNHYSNFHPLLGILPGVFSLPDSDELISGAPLLRRRFLNLSLAQSDPLYVHHFTRFSRAMKERNHLLRSKKETAIECFEEEMALSSTYLIHKREQLVSHLKEPLLKYGKELTGEKEDFEIKYLSSAPKTAEKYLKVLHKNRKKEKEIGSTLVGPHRDDLSFWISKKEAPLFASLGQKRTLVSSLRLAEWEELHKALGEKPIMVIDDLGPPLDSVRLSHLVQLLKGLGQVFTTTPTLFEELKEFSPRKIQAAEVHSHLI